MRIEDYPAQEPLSALGRAYDEKARAAATGIAGVEEAYGDDPYQRLSIHRAPRPSGDVLVFFHGGGWTNGYKEWMEFMAPALTARGVTFVSAGYRLAPQHLFPVCVDDAARAVAWLHGHIGAHGGEPGRVFVGGHSAGGHLAALLAVARAWRADRHLPADAVRGCLPVSGVYRVDAQSGLSMRPRFLGPAGPRDKRRERPDAGTGEEIAMLLVGAGREAGIRPGDLVGAITGEAGINSRELGAIQIADRFSLVEVPAARAEEIIAALKATTIRGRKVPVRRDRDAAR